MVIDLDRAKEMPLFLISRCPLQSVQVNGGGRAADEDKMAGADEGQLLRVDGPAHATRAMENLLEQ